MKEEIKMKMDEHVREILARPSISNEDYALLREKLSEFPAEKSGMTDWMMILLLIIFSGWGGAKNGV